MGLLSLMPFAIGVGFVTLIIFRRDLHTVSVSEHASSFNIRSCRSVKPVQTVCQYELISLDNSDAFVRATVPPQIFFLLGVFVNSFVNVVLKKIIAQERPPFPSQMKKYHGNEQSKGYGMPSHHSQFIWFFCFYMVLFLMFRCGTKDSDSVHLIPW
jgi:membrane-associated phospholipid phosphatase